MSALWQKNQPTASLRRVGLLVQSPVDGTLAPRGTNFGGYVYITRDDNDYVAALGTIANRRRALVVADDVVESVDTGADSLTLTGHGYETGDGPFVSDEAMGSIPIGTGFYIISDDANTIGIASTVEDAYAGTRVALTGTETGATISDDVTTKRGIDGWFCYTGTQAETNYYAAEIFVAVLGHATYTAQSTVTLATSGDGDVVLENGYTRDDARRLQLRNAVANIIIDTGTGTYRVRDTADTKDSHHGTLSASGRSSADVDDPT